MFLAQKAKHAELEIKAKELELRERALRVRAMEAAEAAGQDDERAWMPQTVG